MKMDVTGDLRAIERSLGDLNKKLPVAASRAINHAIKKARSVAVDNLSQELPGIKKRNIREAMVLSLSYKDRLTAELTATGVRVPIYD